VVWIVPGRKYCIGRAEEEGGKKKKKKNMARQMEEDTPTSRD
jgi:hypothetical protein